MRSDWLKEQTYEEVLEKLKDHNTLTPKLIQDKHIVSSSCVLSWFRKKEVDGECHGKKSYIINKESFLNLIKKRFEEEELRKEKMEKHLDIGLSQMEWTLVSKSQHDVLREKLNELYTYLGHIVYKNFQENRNKNEE